MAEADIGRVEFALNLPFSTEAEQAVLGGVLLEPARWPAVEHLSADAFFHAGHRAVWGTLAQMAQAQQAIDVITVHQAGGHELRALNAYAESVGSAANVGRYAAIVHDLHVRRQAVQVCRAAMAAACDASAENGARHADQVIDAAVTQLLALQQGAADREPRKLPSLLPGWLDDLQARSEGATDAMSTGLPDLDRVLDGGLRRGEVVVVGARPSMGKTALILALARNLARSAPVLMCSMEDSERMLVSRHVAAAGYVNLADLRAPDRAPHEFWQRTAEGVDKLSALPLWVDDTPAMTLAEVRRKARQVQARDRTLGVVFVDYLQLMEAEGGSESRAYELNAIVRGMKRMAKQLGVCVVVTSQLSREADKTDAPPGLHHLAESGGIEQAADIIGLLWREARRKLTADNKHDAQIEIAKNKNGVTDTVRLFFDGATQRFESVSTGGY